MTIDNICRCIRKPGEVVLLKSLKEPICPDCRGRLYQKEEEKKEYDPENLKYLFANQRKVSTIHCAEVGGKYYLVQIADKDIDVITNWDQKKFLRQGDRFGQVRWGSQVDIVVPLEDGMEYEILCKPLDYVESGIDPIIQIGKVKDA